jgi:hypothetical protein
MKSGDRLTFLSILNKKVGVMLQVPCEGGGPVSTTSSSPVDGSGGTVLPWLVQVPTSTQVLELVRDEVELAEGDLLAWPHFFWFITEVEDGSYLKHNTILYAKGPYLAHQLSDYLAPAIPSNEIA